MTLSDIWTKSYNEGKANYFIIINNILSLFIIGCHGLLAGSTPPASTITAKNSPHLKFPANFLILALKFL